MGKPAAANAEIVHQINTALEGAVADVLAQLVPELRDLPRRRVLESIFDDINLLERCFTAFRDNPERFHHMLVNQHKVPIKTANELLRCGRSLEDVVAMVVRTAAKRHFRRNLDGDSRPLKGRRKKAAEVSLFGRLMSLLTHESRIKPQKSRGHLLYEAFQDNLRHDWQVPLVPEYATLSPQLVRRLGARILDYHVVADIRALKDNPYNLPTPTPVEVRPLLAPPPAPPAAAAPAAPTAPIVGKAGAPGVSPFAPPPLPRLSADRGAADQRARIEDVLTADGRRLKPAAFTAALLDPAVREVLPDGGAMVHIAQVLSSVGGVPAKMLVGDLGMRTDQLAVLLISANAALGDAQFAEIFGNSGRVDVLAKLIARARAAGVDQGTPVKVIAALARTSFPAKR